MSLAGHGRRRLRRCDGEPSSQTYPAAANTRRADAQASRAGIGCQPWTACPNQDVLHLGDDIDCQRRPRCHAAQQPGSGVAPLRLRVELTNTVRQFVRPSRPDGQKIDFAITYLASPLSDFINGADIPVRWRRIPRCRQEINA